MDLTTKQPIKFLGDDVFVPQAPCIFCGRVIGHINDCLEVDDNCVGFMAGGIVDGRVEHFLYCADPVCDERAQAEAAGDGVRDCSCESYRAYDVVGPLCHVCRREPQEPGGDSDDLG